MRSAWQDPLSIAALVVVLTLAFFSLRQNWRGR